MCCHCRPPMSYSLSGMIAPWMLLITQYHKTLHFVCRYTTVVTRCCHYKKTCRNLYAQIKYCMHGVVHMLHHQPRLWARWQGEVVNAHDDITPFQLQHYLVSVMHNTIFPVQMSVNYGIIVLMKILLKFCSNMVNIMLWWWRHPRGGEDVRLSDNFWWPGTG